MAIAALADAAGPYRRGYMVKRILFPVSDRQADLGRRRGVNVSPVAVNHGVSLLRVRVGGDGYCSHLAPDRRPTTISGRVRILWRGCRRPLPWRGPGRRLRQ